MSGSNAVISEPVTFETPIKRGAEKIASVQIRKPQSGELRGMSLHDLLKFDVNALHQVLPRVTVPSLTTEEIQDLDPCDLVALAGELGNFFLPKGERPDSRAQ